MGRTTASPQRRPKGVLTNMEWCSPTSSSSSSRKSSPFRKENKEYTYTVADVTKNLKWIIFPDNKWIKTWDTVMLVALILLSFILPYQIGVSGGFSLLTNIPWFICNVFLNSIFFVDTFLYFFRPYTNKEGQLVLNVSRIRKHYLRTYFVPNFISVLPFTLAFYIVGTSILDDPFGTSSSERTFFKFIKVGEVLKLVRLVRVGPILSSSQAVTNLRLKRKSQNIQLVKHVLMIVVVSHWFACIWAFVAYAEANSLTIGLVNKPNWIGFWYDGNGVEGGLNPIGIDRHTERYALALFWSIQTITSIGYGNIVPVTVAEWYISCVLQLTAGVMWAFVIGGLVGVVSGMQGRDEAFRTRADQANELIQQFSDVHDTCDVAYEVEGPKEVATQIRNYIHHQYKRSNASTSVSHLSEMYPVFDSLTPDLQEKSSVLILEPYVQNIPYLSSKYLSPEAQRNITVQCDLMEFSAGDVIRMEKGPADLGRGIVILRRGVALIGTKRGETGNRFDLMTAGSNFGAGAVFVSETHPAAKGLMKFLTYSRVLFIPREAVFTALKMNPTSWKGSARWVYLRTLLLYHKEVAFTQQLEKAPSQNCDENQSSKTVSFVDENNVQIAKSLKGL